MAVKLTLKRQTLKAICRDILRCLYICIILEFGVFPFLCGKWHDSRYFRLSDLDLERIIEEANNVRQSKAENYFDQISPENTLDFYRRINQESDLKLLVLVLSVKRNKADYLIQTVAALDQQIKTNNLQPESKKNIGLVVCNADLHPETHRSAQDLGQYVPVETIPLDERSSYCCTRGKCNSDAPSVKEKADYAECTAMAFKKYKFDFLLVIQDDVVAKEDALSNIIQILDNRFDDDRHNGTWIMSKFFYPPNYLGFEINLESVLEIISLTTLLASLILLVYNRLFKHKSIKAIRISRIILVWSICLAFIFALGRQNTVLSIRQSFLSYSLRPAPSGSLTAVLYPADKYRDYLLPFLKNQINCSSKYPLDFAIQDYLDEEIPFDSYFVEGRFFDHVGHFSSLGGTKKLNPLSE